MIQNDDKDNQFPVEFFKASSIRHICYGNPEFSLFYFSFLAPEVSLEIIKSLFVSEPPKIFRTTKSIQSPLHYRWLIACLISKFESYIKGNFQRFILPKYYFNTQQKIKLSLINSISVTSINKLVSNPQIRIENILQMKLAKQLLKLLDENRSLCEWIAEDRTIVKFFKNLPIDELFSKFNFKCLQLFQSNSKPIFGDSQKFNSISFNFSEIDIQKEFFNIPSALIDQTPIEYYQIDFLNKNPYPTNDSDPILSLINASTIKSEFFIDFYRNYIKSQIVFDQTAIDHDESKKLEEKRILKLNDFISKTDFIGDMQSWCYLSLFPSNFINNYELYSNQVEFLKFSSQNIITELFERLKNDRILLKNLQNWTGYLVIANDFKTKSLPKQLGLYLNNLTPDSVYSLITSKKLLCLNDFERKIDSDFLNGYLVFINLIKMAKCGQNFESIEKISTVIETAIRNIEGETQISIIRDAFSFLFITDSNGQFFVPPLMVTTVLQILLNFYDETLVPFLQKALAQIQAAQQLNPNLASLSDVLISPKEKLFESLTKGNFTVSEYLSKFNEQTEILFKRYMAVHKLKNSEQINLNELTIEEIEECAMAIQGQFELFQRIENETTIPELKKLTKLFDYRKPFEISKSIPNEEFENLISKLTDSNSSEWITPSFNYSQFKLTKSFFDYFDLLIPPLLENSNTINDILNESADEIIEKFLNKEDYEKAEKVANLVQLDIQKKVLNELKYTENCYRRYIDNIPIVLDTISIYTNIKYNENSNLIDKIRSIIKLYKSQLNLPLTSNTQINQFNEQNIQLKGENDHFKNNSNGQIEVDLNKQIEYEDSINQYGFNVSKTDLNNAFNLDNFELFIDLSYRCDLDLIEQIITEKADDENIEKICELVKYLPVSLKFVKQIEFLFSLKQNGFTSIKDIELSFSKSLNENLYSISHCFYLNFPEKSNQFDHLLIQFLHHIQKAHMKADNRILTVSPHLNSQILEIFSKIENENEINEFKEKVPSNWVFMNGIQKTLIGNFFNNPNIAFSFLKEYSKIDIDSTIIEYIEQQLNETTLQSLSKLHFFLTQIKQFISVIRNISLFIEFFFKKLFEIFSDIKIESEIDENSINRYFKSIHLIITTFSIHENISQILSLKQFCSEYFFTRFNFAYQFDHIDELIQFCLDHAYYSIAIDLSKSFSIDITEQCFEIYLKQFRLSIFSLSNRSIPFSFTNKQLQTKCSQKFQYYAQKPPEFNAELISNLSSNISIVHKNNHSNELQLIIQKMLNAPIKYITKDTSNNLNERRNEEIFNFMKNESDLSIATSFYVFDMEKAFLILDSYKPQLNENEYDSNQINDHLSYKLNSNENQFNQNQFDLNETQFDNLSNQLNSNQKHSIQTKENQIHGINSLDDFNDLYFQFIGNNSNEMLSKIDLRNLDSNKNKLIEKSFLHLFESSISFSQINAFSKSFEQHQNYSIYLNHIYEQILNDHEYESYLLMNISRMIGRHLCTAKSALSLYLHKPELSLLDIAERAIHDLNNEQKMKNILNKIDFQRRFIIFCTEKNLHEFKCMNLFLGEQSDRSIIILLFKHYEFDLSIDILKSKLKSHKSKNWLNENVSKEFIDIIQQTAISISNDGYQSVCAFIERLQNAVKDEQLFELIVFMFFEAIDNVLHEIEWIRNIILNIIRKGEFQVKLLLNICDFDNAANVAIGKNIKEIIPYISNKSFSMNKLDTYMKCQKALGLL